MNKEKFGFLSCFEEISSGYYEVKQPTDVGRGERNKNRLKRSRKKQSSLAVELIPKKKKRRKIQENQSSPSSRETENNHQQDLIPEADNEGISYGNWDGLFVPSPVLSALEDLGFSHPTPIQRLVLPSAIRDRLDILGAAETISCLVGGLSVEKQQRLLRRKPEILVATPGRLWALIEEASDSDYLWSLKSIRYLVIDETDRMVEKGHFEELTKILEHIGLGDKERGERQKQTFVFSATLTYVHPPPKRLSTACIHLQQLTAKEKLDSLVSLAGLRKQRKIIDITRPMGTAEGITEARINCSNLEEKDTAVYYFLQYFLGRTLVFTNSIDAARRLHSILTKLQLTPLLLHARMHQKQRLKNLEKFTENDKSVMLATDVAARGLDIQGIQHVIHYQVPRTAEVYVHRSGRTARATSLGLAVMLIDPNDATFYRRICRNLNRERDLPVFPVRNQEGLRILKDRIRVATQLESLEHRVRRMVSRESWFQRNAREADLDFDEMEIGKTASVSREELEKMKKSIKDMEKQLKYLLGQSLPQGIIHILHDNFFVDF